MIGLKTSRKTVAESVNLINKVKINIDEFKDKIKYDRDEVRKKIEDIKFLKSTFSSLDEVLDDFSKIYAGEIVAKEWDFLFPQIIQSLIDVEYFMKNQLPSVHGFHPGKELSAYVAFMQSIKRLKKIGDTQNISLVPGEYSSEKVINSIGKYV